MVDQGASRLRRIAVLSLHTSPTAALGHSANGGLNVYVRQLGEALAARGIASDVFTRATVENPPGVESLGPRFQVVHLPVGPADEVPKAALLRYAGSFAVQVHRFAREHGLDYDLLHSHYWLSGAAACTLRQLTGTPWAHTAHTLALVKNRTLAPGAVPESEMRVRVERDITECADLLVASTAQERDELVRGYGADPGRIVVVPPGVEFFEGAPARRPVDPPYVLFVGRLERLKGVEIALRAFAELAGPNPDLRFRVIGGDSLDSVGSERDRLERIVEELGLESRVDFLGAVPRPRLVGHYAGAQLLVLPSYSESFGLVALEAMACGCPLVVSGAAGVAELARSWGCGITVARQDPGAYADAMRQVLEHPEAACRMGDQGRRAAAIHGWDDAAGRLLQAFAAVRPRSSEMLTYAGLQTSPAHL